MSEFTNLGLVELAKKALNENWGYVNGTFGNILTENLLNQKCNQAGGVGEYNSYWRNKYIKNFIGKRVSDCYGLVKAYTWWTDEDSSPKYNNNNCIDRNQEGAYAVANEKGLLSTMPEIKGLILWMKGHVGIYIGNGEFIECAGCPVGMRKGTIKNGVITSGSQFTHWFKDNWITYIEEDKDIDVNEALKILKEKSVLNTTEYWENAVNVVKYLDTLLINMAKKLN